jgi:sugar lactone lactonase YvrE
VRRALLVIVVLVAAGSTAAQAASPVQVFYQEDETNSAMRGFDKADGSLWLLDISGSGFYRIETDGKFSKYQPSLEGPADPAGACPAPPAGPGGAGFGPPASTGGGIATKDGSLWWTLAGAFLRRAPGGRVTRVGIDANATIFNPVQTADGAVWFGLVCNSGDQSTHLGHVDPDGGVEVVPGPSGDRPFSFGRGPDGRLWFIEESGRVGRVAADGGVTEVGAVPLAPRSKLQFPVSRLIAGPDGNLWFSSPSSSAVGRISPAGAVKMFPVPDSPYALLSAPDGNLWFVRPDGNAISRITPAGQFDAGYKVPSSPHRLTIGPDGALWFTGENIHQVFVGRIPLETEPKLSGPSSQSLSTPRSVSTLVTSAVPADVTVAGAVVVPGEGRFALRPGKRTIRARDPSRVRPRFSPAGFAAARRALRAGRAVKVRLRVTVRGHLADTRTLTRTISLR